MADWAPPKAGLPCWVEIPAADVGRAKEFYRSVFDWRFKPTPPPNSEDELAMFSYPDDAFKDLDGGIVKIDGDRKIRSERGTIVYLYAHDIEEMIAKITEAGGKPIGKKQSLDFGWYHHFEDTEGNYCGIYSARKDK